MMLLGVEEVLIYIQTLISGQKMYISRKSQITNI